MTRLIALQDEVEAYRSQVESLEVQLQINPHSDHLLDHSSVLKYDENSDEVKRTIRSILQPAFLEKEKYRMEAEKERRKRHKLEGKVKRLERELELCHLGEGEDIYLINKEQGRAIGRLQKQLISAIQDIDQLRQQDNDVDHILRQLFHRIPNLSSRNISEPGYAEKFSRYTLDRFIVKVTDLIEENHQLIDRVLDLQSRQERLDRS